MTEGGHHGHSLWDHADGFFYDTLHLPDGRTQTLKVRSLVGLLPLFAVETIEPDMIDDLEVFDRRLHWFVHNRPHLAGNMASVDVPGVGRRRLLSILTRERLLRVLKVMLNEQEFLSEYGIRSVSKFHQAHPVHVPPGRARAHRGVPAGGVHQRPVRRQLQLARPDLVPDQLPDHRVPAEVPPLLRG